MKYTLSIFLLFVTLFSFGQKLSTSSRKAKKLYEEASYHLTYGQYYEANEKLQKAIKADPNFYEAFLLLGDLNTDMKQNKTAIRYYKKSLELNADFYPQAYYYVAKLLNEAQ